MSAYVGIDVSKATLEIAIQQAEQTTHFQVINTPDGFQHLRQRLALCPLIERMGTGSQWALWRSGCPRFCPGSAALQQNG